MFSQEHWVTPFELNGLLGMGCIIDKQFICL